MPESIFDKARACDLFKKSLRNMCFPVNFMKSFKNIFLVKHLETPTSVSTVSMQRLYVIDCVLKFRSRGPEMSLKEFTFSFEHDFSVAFCHLAIRLC